MSRRFGLLLVCCVLLAACSAGSAASSSPTVRVTLAGTFTDDGFQASDYDGNACATFESGTWQVQVKLSWAPQADVIEYVARIESTDGSGTPVEIRTPGTAVTVFGRITAVLIMLVGLLTLAVVTAQVASNFVVQGPSRTPRSPQPEAAPPGVTLAELDRRLARIEELLTVSASSQRTATAPGTQGENPTQPSDPQ